MAIVDERKYFQYSGVTWPRVRKNLHTGEEYLEYVDGAGDLASIDVRLIFSVWQSHECGKNAVIDSPIRQHITGHTYEDVMQVVAPLDDE